MPLLPARHHLREARRHGHLAQQRLRPEPDHLPEHPQPEVRHHVPPLEHPPRELHLPVHHLPLHRHARPRAVEE